MRESLDKYRRLIQEGRVNPMRRWDGWANGPIFDPADEDVPLTFLSFAAYNLASGGVVGRTEANEGVLVPLNGTVEVTVTGRTLSTSRPGGPFAHLPASSNASAIYLGRDSRVCHPRARRVVGLLGTGPRGQAAGPGGGRRPAEPAARLGHRGGATSSRWPGRRT